METLKLGVAGPEVKRWLYFLRGLDIYMGDVQETFGLDAEVSTMHFQVMRHLDVNGTVDDTTLERARLEGFDVPPTPEEDESGPCWPAKPTDIKQLSSVERARLFGTFKFKPAPQPDNPEAIQILDNWDQKNVSLVEIPQLKTVKYGPRFQKVQWNTKVAGQIQALFAAWEQAGLMHHVLTWGGSWNSRFIRGSQVSLSNHAWATAFDINVPWNGLGSHGALKGRPGSVRELVDVALEHGFYWGGWFSRLDPMHFEVFRVDPK